MTFTYDVAGELVEAGCTAIIATNTAMTHSVLNYVEDRNLKLGEEIAVGGFVDSDFANRFMHRIPVVYEPMKEMGKLAGEMIVEKIEDKNRKIPVPFRSPCLFFIKIIRVIFACQRFNRNFSIFIFDFFYNHLSGKFSHFFHWLIYHWNPVQTDRLIFA